MFVFVLLVVLVFLVFDCQFDFFPVLLIFCLLDLVFLFFQKNSKLYDQGLMVQLFFLRTMTSK